MKRFNIVAIPLTCVFLFCVSCKTSESSKEVRDIAEISNKIDSMQYTFVPYTAVPVRGRTINLNYNYILKVNKDTIEAFLPYFGRAYLAPIAPDEGGIRFVSKDFDYKISNEKKDMWDVTIVPKDTKQYYRLILKIGNTGYTTLTVLDNNRDPISFYGKIE